MTGIRQRLDVPAILLFVVPALMSGAGAGSAAKLIFPIAATMIAAVFAQRDPPRYLRLVFWTIMLAPGLRHFNDYHAGFSLSNPIMLAPYLVVFAAAPTVALYLVTGRRYAGIFLAMIGIIVLGAGFSLMTGALTDPLMAAMRWLAPPCLGIYICARSDCLTQIREGMTRTFRFALPVMAIYGLVQFTSIAPWDAFYMKEAPITSIGYPVPFQVRVFGTMNSPGSLAAMLTTAMLLLLPTTKGFQWIGILLAVATLFLTTQRAAWGGLVFSTLLVFIVARDPTVRRSIGKMVLAFAVAAAITLVTPGATQKLQGSLSSVSQLDQDGSAKVRQEEYVRTGAMLDNHPLGRGLAWYSNKGYFSAGEEMFPVDSGLIDIMVSFGVAGGMLFLSLLGCLFVIGLRISRRTAGAGAAAEFGVVAFGLVQLPFGGQQTSEHGMFLYLGVGLLLARSVPALYGRLTGRERIRRPITTNSAVLGSPAAR